MALLPVTLRRRLRSSGFTEAQTDALQETSDVTVEVAKEGLIKEENAQAEYQALRSDNLALRSEFMALRSEVAELRSEVAELRTDLNAQIALIHAEMRALKWWLFGALSGVILAATAAIIAAIAAWG